MFLNCVSDVVGKQIEFPKWFDADEVTKVEAEVQAKTAAKEHVPKMAAISNHYDPVWVCSNSGFAVGTLVVEIGVESWPEVFLQLLQSMMMSHCIRLATFLVIQRRFPSASMRCLKTGPAASQKCL